MSPARKNKTNWTHPLYRNGYIKNRSGTCQLVINHNNKQYRKSLNLTFQINNKSLALEILETEVLRLLYGKDTKIIYIQDLFKQFKEFKKQSVKTATMIKYEQTYKSFITTELSTTDNIKSHILNNIIKSELSQSTKNKQLTLLKGFFAFCVEHGHLATNPITKSMIPELITKEIDTYSNEEIKRLLDYFENINQKMVNLIKLVNLTGMRISEALAFKREHIDKNIIRIFGKGDRVRFIPLEPFPELQAFIFTFQFNLWVKTDFPQRLFRDACLTLNIKNLGIHGIRKTFENRLIDMDIPSDLVADILGHTPEVQRKNYRLKTKGKQLETRLKKFVK